MTLAATQPFPVPVLLDDLNHSLFSAGTAGVYEAVHASDYHALDAASASRLNMLRRSPAHCKHAIDNPDANETDAKNLGTAAHSCLLEPGTFNGRYAVAPDLDLRTKKGQTEYEIFADKHIGKTILRGRDGERLIAMHRSVWAHPAACRHLSKSGKHELSLIWTDKTTGEPCKARLDFYCGDGAIYDFKCVRDASPEGFAKAIAAYGWHRCGAFYLRGAQARGLDATAFVHIAVENEPPHNVGMYAIEDPDIEQGDREMSELLLRYRKCRIDDVWPGYSGDIEFIRLPKWAQDNSTFE